MPAIPFALLSPANEARYDCITWGRTDFTSNLSTPRFPRLSETSRRERIWLRTVLRAVSGLYR